MGATPTLTNTDTCLILIVAPEVYGSHSHFVELIPAELLNYIAQSTIAGTPLGPS